MNPLLEQALKLPIIERRKLADDIYDSIALEPGGDGLTIAQIEEIGRRLEEHRRKPEAAIPLDKFLERFDAR